MRKIRDFKLHLHFKELRRRARRSIDLAAAGANDDASFQAVLDRLAASARPAVMFESFGPEAETAKLSPIPGLAHTLGVGTLGPAIAPLIAEARAQSEARGLLYELVAAYGLEQIVHFVTDLLQDELETERCELSPIHYVVDPAALAAVLTALPGAKINVEIVEGRLAPEHTTAWCLSWIALRGRKGAKTAAVRKK
jgi:hypothetical protein